MREERNAVLGFDKLCSAGERRNGIARLHVDLFIACGGRFVEVGGKLRKYRALLDV